MKTKLDIIYEDEALLFINKPSGFLTIPDRFNQELPNLYRSLTEKYGKIFIVHRLDKETSGGIVFAKNERVHKLLNQQFENRTVQKVYHAIVEGQLHQPSGYIDKPVAPSQTRPGKMVIAARGKESITQYQLIEQFQHYALLELDIKTGRTHQIRVHLQALGYPLIVDDIYGHRNAFFLSALKHKKYRIGKDQIERPLLSRTALHASRLHFDHPGTGKRMELEAPMHKDMRALLNQLRKWNS